MRRLLFLAGPGCLILTLLVAALFPTLALADPAIYGTLTMGEGFLNDPNMRGFNNLPGIGDPLIACGRVTNASSSLIPALVSYGTEFTWTIDGATVSSVMLWDGCGIPVMCGGIGVDWTGGLLRIWGDPTPNATYSDPASFQGSTLILAAPISVIHLITGVPGDPDPLHIDGQFTEGAALPQVSTGEGVAFYFQARGDISGDGDNPSLRELGYDSPLTFTLTVLEPVPVAPTTWGGIKALYSGR